MTIYKTHTGQQITLAGHIGGGGEGDVYSVKGQPNKVAKIFNAKTLADPFARRESKLRVMIANPPIDEMQARWGRPTFAWPTASLHGPGGFAGYLMPRIENARPIFTLYNPRERSKGFSTFTWQSLHVAASNLAIAVNALHHKDYVFGDVNEGNIVVTQDAFVTFLDTDSFQVRDPKTGQVYRCLVGKPEFTPSELQGKTLSNVDRTPHHDAFGLAILIFQLLMEGTHPFNGVPLSTKRVDVASVHVENIRNGVFPYVANGSYGPPPFAPAYCILHPELRRLFETCFVTGHGYPSLRPAPLEWMHALNTASASLIQCAQNRSHWYGNHLSACPWCGRPNQTHGTIPLQVPITPAVQPSPPIAIKPSPPPHPATATQPSSQGFPFAKVAVGIIAILLAIFVFRAITDPASPTPTPIVQVTPENQGVQGGAVAAPTRTLPPDATREPAATREPIATREPTASREPTATRKPTATREPTATNPPSASNIVWREFGSTVRGSPLEVVRLGTGPNEIVLVGGLHAGFAPASVSIAEGLVSYFEDNTGRIPDSVSVYIVPTLNKDGRYNPGEWGGRINANGVDLNRNWDCDWKPDATWRNVVMEGSGGSAPFSEPETRALRDLLLQIDPQVVIFWGALIRNGLVAPGQCASATATTRASYDVAEIFGKASGYSVNDYEVAASQVINGDVTNWLDKIGIPSFFVVLEDYESTNWQDNLRGVLAVLEYYAR